jgi:hypothetical protein
MAGSRTNAGMSSGSYSMAMPVARSWPVAPHPKASCPGISLPPLSDHRALEPIKLEGPTASRPDWQSYRPAQLGDLFQLAAPANGQSG